MKFRMYGLDHRELLTMKDERGLQLLHFSPLAK